jgi:hypothetical protein
MRSKSEGATATNPAAPNRSVTSRMCRFTPKISCTTTIPAGGRDVSGAGSAR